MKFVLWAVLATPYIGRSHDPNYVLFRIGHTSSAGFKEFAESGRSDTLDAQSQGDGGVFDEFNAPPVPTGEGRTEAEFFVDSNHSTVREPNTLSIMWRRKAMYDTHSVDSHHIHMHLICYIYIFIIHVSY